MADREPRDLDCSKCRRATSHVYQSTIPLTRSVLERWNCTACRRDQLVDAGPVEHVGAALVGAALPAVEMAERAVARLADGDAGEPLPKAIARPKLRDMSPAEPGDELGRRARRDLARPFVPDGKVADRLIAFDGADLRIEPGSSGRALVTLHEHGTGTSVARATRAQLTEAIRVLAAARDALPEVAS